MVTHVSDTSGEKGLRSTSIVIEEIHVTNPFNILDQVIVEEAEIDSDDANVVIF